MTYVNNYMEVNDMPRRDGTGPMGAGKLTGRGLGFCTGTNVAKCGAGFGVGIGIGLGLARRRGFGRGFSRNDTSNKTSKELLQEQKDILKKRLEVIDRELENL